MKKILCALFLASSGVFVGSEPASADFIGILTQGGVVRLTINGTTSTQTSVGNLGSGNNFGSMALSSSGLVYAIGGTSGNLLMKTLDPTTGIVTSVGTLSGVVPTASPTGLAFSPTGDLFASSVSRLYKIDPTTGASVLIGDAGIGGAAFTEIAFSASGTLYGWALGGGRGLTTIDPLTGLATIIGNPSSVPAPGSLTFDNLGTLWGTSTVSGIGLETINTATGAVTVAGIAAGSGIQGIAYVAPVPVPAALWLFGSGLAAMVGLARRKMDRLAA